MKQRVKRIHFVGIGGAGMCGLAEVLYKEFDVSGSDQAQSAVTRQLADMGIKVFHGHAAEHIEGVDVVVTSTAIKPDNPEVLAAREAGIPVIPRAMMLAEIMRFGQGIAIAGTHGKTTTTSLTASILTAAGLDPTFVIGGKLTAVGTNAKLGGGQYIVAEADESDASFLYLTPVITVVTSVDKLHQAFVEFVHRMPFYGKAFLCIDSEHVRAILPHIKKPFATYGLDETADIYADNVHSEGAQMCFTVHLNKRPIAPFEVRLNAPGRHNVLNALAAIGVALECGADVEAIQRGLAGFGGVGRRFQSYGEIKLPQGGSALVVDDYGHHPVEMAATLAAARGLFEDFVRVLNTADAVVLTDVYAAGEEPIVAADSRALTRALRVAGKLEPIYCADVADMPATLLNMLQDGDLLLNMGAGSINKVPQALRDLAAHG